MRLILTIGLVVVVLVGLAWAFQRHLIYLPSGAVQAPDAVGLPDAEPVTLRTADDLELGAWFVPPAAPSEGSTVLVFNGNAGNRSGRAPLASALARSGLGVLLFDYRGYGGNPGAPSEEGLLADAEAARAALLDRPGVDPARIVYFGESLGSGVAAALAVNDPPAAMVLRSPFASLAEVGRLHYPFLPVGTLLRDRFPIAEQIARYDGPLLVIAGERDSIIPPDQSRRVAGAAPPGARFTLIPGADHNDPALFDGDRLLDEVLRFLRDEELVR